MGEDLDRVGAPDLWRLSVTERRLSGVRRRLHAQIDGGAADESIRMRERRVSGGAHCTNGSTSCGLSAPVR